MKKKKGFTLIELLAVIVILAVIALIAVPVILNVIDKAKNGAAEQSAQGYVDAIEKQIMTNQVKNENLIEEGEYTKAELDAKNVQIKGEITDAVVVVGAKGKVTQGRFCVDGYSIDYDGKKAIKNTEDNYCNEIKSILNTCPYEVNQVFNFEYTGDIQEFNIECPGKYKLEVWGAQGGESTYGGKGAYVTGNYTSNDNKKLYVVVGGQGIGNTLGSSESNKGLGGYNGGGFAPGYASSSNYGQNFGGGGATHIAEVTGLLASLSSSENKEKVLLVAGAGGGGMRMFTSSWESNFTSTNGQLGPYGGYASGTGSAASGNNWCCGGYGAGATQNSGGAGGSAGNSASTGGTAGTFGAGGNGSRSSSYYSGSGGGAGWYGGGGSGGGCGGSTGGGGSSHIGNVESGQAYAGNQTFKAPNGNNETGHSGSGYARITYLGEE